LNRDRCQHRVWAETESRGESPAVRLRFSVGVILPGFKPVQHASFCSGPSKYTPGAANWWGRAISAHEPPPHLHTAASSGVISIGTALGSLYNGSCCQHTPETYSKPPGPAESPRPIIRVSVSRRPSNSRLLLAFSPCQGKKKNPNPKKPAHTAGPTPLCGYQTMVSQISRHQSAAYSEDHNRSSNNVSASRHFQALEGLYLIRQAGSRMKALVVVSRTPGQHWPSAGVAPQ